MSKWQEDTLYEITMSIKKLGLAKEFNEVMQRIRTQPEHKYKTVSERYEYAYRVVNENK
jgi:hypothetical protein